MIKLELQLFATGGDEPVWGKPTNFENDTQWKEYLKTQYQIQSPSKYAPASSVLLEMNSISADTISKSALNLYLNKMFTYALDNTSIYIEPFDIEKNDSENLYFSCKLKNIINYGNFFISIIQLDGNYSEYNVTNTKEWIYDHILETSYIVPNKNLLNDDNLLEYKKTIIKNPNTTQICICLYTLTSEYYDFNTQEEADALIKKINPILNPFSDFVYGVWAINNWSTVFQSQFKEVTLNYFQSDTIPNIEVGNIDFSQLWLCTADIYDAENNIIYQKNKLYTIDTSTTTYSWVATNYTQSQIDNGIKIIFFSNWKEITIIGAMNQLNEYANLTATIADMMLSFSDTTWQPKSGEQYWGKNIKISGEKGIYIYNTVDGYNRVIDEKQDISKDNNGNINWKLTADGQLVKNQEVTGTLTQGHIIIVPGADGNRYYYV